MYAPLVFTLMALAGSATASVRPVARTIEVRNEFTGALPDEMTVRFLPAPPSDRSEVVVPVESSRISVSIPASVRALALSGTGFEDVTVSLGTLGGDGIQLRPLAVVRVRAESTGGRNGTEEIRLFVQADREGKAREVPVLREAEFATAQIEAGEWRGAVAVGKTSLVPVEFRVAPGQKLDLDTRKGIALRRVRARIVTPAKQGVRDIAPVWRSQRDGRAAPDRDRSEDDRDAESQVEVVGSALAALSGRSDPDGFLPLVLPARSAGTLTLETKGYRRVVLRQGEGAPAEIPELLVLSPLPEIEVVVPKLHAGEAATLSVRLALASSDRWNGDHERPPSAHVRAGESVVLKALADADHSIEVRDAVGRLAGIAVVSTRDRDWAGATVTRVLERAQRQIRGRVLWNDEPLADCAIVGLLRRSGEDGDGGDRLVPTLPPDGIESLADAARTDSSGEFVLTVNVPGRYSVVAFPPGFTTGKSARGSVDTEAVEQKPVEVRFSGRYLSVRVVDDETGEPIQGAQVEVKSKAAEDSGKAGAYSSTVKATDREGGVTALGLLGGPLVVTVSAKGYAGRRLTPKPSSDLPPVTTEVRLKVGMERSIRCLDENGVPLSGVEVLGLSEEARGTPFSPVQPLGHTDLRGTCTFDDQGPAFPHLVLLAAGKVIRVIPYFAGAEGDPAPVSCVLHSIGFGPSVRLMAEEKGKVWPVSRLPVVASFEGLLLPWNQAVSRKAEMDGAPDYLETGPDGGVGLARTLGAGSWELVGFHRRPQSLENPSLLRLGTIAFPVSKDEIVTIRRK